MRTVAKWWRGRRRTWRRMPSVRTRAELGGLEPAVTVAWVRDEGRVYLWHESARAWVPG